MSGRPSAALERHRDVVRQLVDAAGVRDVRVFGSVARGEDGPDSDLDVLGTLPETMGLVELVALEQSLEDLLGVRVDVVDARSCGRVIDRALAEGVPL